MAVLAPSILSADFANLARDIATVEQAGATLLHVDVMDGHFVPNLTIGPPVLRSIRKVTRLQLDVHLMITNAEQLAAAFVDEGADLVTVHYEAVDHLDQVLTSLKKKKVLAGVSLNPHTPVGVLEEILYKCDIVLIMSVNPGYGGQEIISTSFEKVRKLKKLISTHNLNTKISIDGGIGLHNISEAVHAGVDIVVAGSAIFGSQDPAQTFLEMTKIANTASEEKPKHDLFSRE